MDLNAITSPPLVNPVDRLVLATGDARVIAAASTAMPPCANMAYLAGDEANTPAAGAIVAPAVMNACAWSLCAADE